MNQALKEIMAAFKAKNEKELFAKRSKDKQFKAFALSAHKPSLVTMSADDCKKLCEKAGLSYFPGYEGRVIQYLITNEAQDRYGDIVRAKGADLTNYTKNPTVQYAHDYKSPPIGKTIKIWIERSLKGVQAWGLFYDANVDDTEWSETIFKFAKTGAMPACSIGFIPIETYRPKDKDEREKLGLGEYGLEFKIWELLEWSPCSIGANPQALENYFKSLRDASIFNQKDIDLAAKFNLFKEPNLLDVFAETIKGKTGKEISFPKIDLKDHAHPPKIGDRAHPLKSECSPADPAGGGEENPDNAPPEKEAPDDDLDTVEQASAEELTEFEKEYECTEAKDIGIEEVVKPYANEHACRLRNPNKYDKFRRGKRTSDGKVYSIIFGKLKGKKKWEEQAYRYNKEVWTEAQARKHCKKHNGIAFEPASGNAAGVVVNNHFHLKIEGMKEFNEGLAKLNLSIEKSNEIFGKLTVEPKPDQADPAPKADGGKGLSGVLREPEL